MEVQGEKPVEVPLGHHFAVAAAYAACYEVTRHFSFSHWILTAGLRLACLLLVPRRFWPALVIGEALPMMENAILCAPSLGTPWAVLSSFPIIAFCMPAVAAIRRRMPLHDARGGLRIPTILVVTLACAVITAIRTDLAVFMAYAFRPDGMEAWKAEAVADFFAYLLGSYLGALTLTPVLLALHQQMRERGVGLGALMACAMVRETVCVTAPCLLILALVARMGGSPVVVELARLGIVLPVCVATMRHGWQGGALAGMLSSIAMASTAVELLDPVMIRAQVVLALTISASLIVGSRIAHRATRNPRYY